MKVESVLMDNSVFAIVFDIQLQKAVGTFNYLKMEDLVIRDEKGGVLYGEGIEGQLATTGDGHVAVSENGLDIKRSYIINNDNHTNPQSAQIYITFSGLKFFNRVNGGSVAELWGDWAFELDMSDKFINREAYQYIADENPDVEITSAALTPTGLDIEIRFKNEPFSLNEMTLTDGEGNEYSNNRGIAVEEGAYVIRTTFPITVYNASDALTLRVPQEKEIVVELNRVK
ncbi:MAG: hypothetical protein LBT12_07170 [Oscillospiraceae bacterium]|nr:hypothetical protein [Oscillospiraceae bacterium]